LSYAAGKTDRHTDVDERFTPATLVGVSRPNEGVYMHSTELVNALCTVCVCVGTQYALGVVLYNERSHYRRIYVRNVTVVSYVCTALNSEDFRDQLQPSDVFFTG